MRELLALLVPVVLIGVLALNDGGNDVILRQQAWLIIWWALALGFAFGILPRSVPPRGWLVATAGLCLLGALQLVAMLWGPSADNAIADACRSAGYLGLLALAWSALGPRTWATAAAGLFAVGAAITAYALLGRVVPGSLGLDDPFGAGRLAEPLGYWNALGAWAAITLAMALSWAAGARRRRTRALAAALMPLAGTVVYLTYSRGAVVAAALGVALVVLLSQDRRRAGLLGLAAAVSGAICILVIRSRPEIANGTGHDGALLIVVCVAAASLGCWAVARRIRTGSAVRAGRALNRRAVASGVVALALVLVGFALVAGRDGFGHGGDAAAFADSDPSARLTTAAGNRSAYWSEAFAGFRAEPVRGEGPGSFAYRWAGEGSDPELVTDPHSLLFGTAAELGLLGLLGLGTLIVGLLMAAARGFAAARGSAPATALAAASIVFLASVMIDWTWASTALATLGIGSAGVLAMAGSEPYRRRRGSREALVRARLRWGIVALALALGAVQIPGVVSSSFVITADEQRRLENPEGAVARADAALVAAPWSAAAYAARARARLAGDQLMRARADALDAIEREPRDARHRILLAEVEAARDELLAAAAALSQAVALSPNEPRLGSREVARVGERLEALGLEESDILAPEGSIDWR